ncbi:MAG: ATP-binding protein [Lachnospiraceae bacterium]|nr:ATP-binding protein [Lachnospiraceae bacterium]
MRNPFSLTFGKEPVNVISRDRMLDEITDGFTAENPEFQVCMITGVRGSGKTVLMTEISNRIKAEKGWIVTELNPERDMLHALAAELSNRKELLQIFKDAKINLSVLGVGVEIDSEPPITDVVVALDRMLQHLTKKEKKILLSLDEAVSNQYVREFSSQFQIFLRKNYNVFLLMTGLYENIYELQNEKTLTFLYRAPKFEMTPLNDTLVAKQYKKVFDISDQEAAEMAELVKGYSYAYQVLGYLCYKKQCSYKMVLEEFDAYLREYVYEKIWSELSGNDREAVMAMALSKDSKVESIRKTMDISSEKFSVYRKRLLKKGIARSMQYGYLSFTLPRFREFVLEAD